MRLLFTGFEPFGKFSSNPSWDALEVAKQEKLVSGDFHIAQIPCVYRSAFETLDAAVQRMMPDALICFGLHGGLSDRDAATIYVETTARNRDGASKPDNSGVTRGEVNIVPDGPPTIAASFEAANIKATLQRAGFSVELSDDAGSYLCNHLFYRAAYTYSRRFPCGFIHVPPVKEMGGVLPLRRLANAMATIANSITGAEKYDG